MGEDGFVYCAGVALLPALVCLLHKLALLRRIGRVPYGSDVFWYLLISRLKREHGSGMPPKVDSFLGSQEFFTPPLLMGLVSWIPPPVLERFHWLPSVLAKTLLVYLLAFFTALSLFHMSSEHVALGALVAGLFYAWSPINRNANPSNLSDFNLSPRPLGTLLVTLQGLTVVVAMVENSWLFILLSAFLAALIFATSAFSAQCLVLGGLVLSVLGASCFPILSFVLGLILVGAWNRAYVWRSLRNTLMALKHYALENYKHCLGSVQSAFCSLNLLRFLKYLAQGRLGPLMDLICRDYVIRGLLFYPLHLICVHLLLSERDWILSEPYLKVMALWWGSAFALFFLTSLPRLRFLGEADRYLEFFGFFPATVLVTVWLLSKASLGLGVGGGLGIGALYFLIGDLFPAPVQEEQEAKSALWDFLRGIEVRGLVMVPVNLAFEAVYRTECSCLFPLPLDERSDHLMHGYPVPVLDPDVWVQVGEVSHIAIERSAIARYPYVADFVQGRQAIYKNQHFLVFENSSPQVVR